MPLARIGEKMNKKDEKKKSDSVFTYIFLVIGTLILITAIFNIGNNNLPQWLLLAVVIYFGWRYYQNELRQVKTKKDISPEVVRAMAKKIKEDAEMHRKGRKEGNN